MNEKKDEIVTEENSPENVSNGSENNSETVNQNVVNQTIQTVLNADSNSVPKTSLEEKESSATATSTEPTSESTPVLLFSADSNVSSGNISQSESDEEENSNSDLADMSSCLDSEGQSLAEVLQKYEIKLSAKKIRLIETYCRELWRVNEHLNLTRHTDYEKFVTRDLIDSIHLADLLQKGEHVLDVGTGGGVPGLLLAILRPDITVELCDSTRKKTEALGNILDVLGLKLNIWYTKGEELLKVHRFHTIVIRAVSRLEKLLRMFAPLWYAFDRMLLIKGHQWIDERGEARHYNLLNNLALRKEDEYVNPGADFPSVILQICQKKQYELLQKRNADRLEGKPIETLPEMIGVEKEQLFPPPTKSRGFKSFSGPKGKSDGRKGGSDKGSFGKGSFGKDNTGKGSFGKGGSFGKKPGSGRPGGPAKKSFRNRRPGT